MVFHSVYYYTNLVYSCVATVLPGNVLYIGMLYHLQRDVATWTTKYTVVRDLEVLRKVKNLIAISKIIIYSWQYLKDNFPHAEQDDVDAFKFKQPEGTLQLQVDSQQQPVGWSVHPRRDPMEVCLLKFFILF